MTSIKNLLSPAEEQRPFSGRSSRQHAKQCSSSGSGRLHFTIEFILDTICPHCYIGLRNLNTAIHLYKQQYPNATFEVACSPFMLKPDAGCSVDVKRDFYMRMRGFSPDTLDQWSRQGAEVGINFNWDGGRTGNSRDSHKLLRLALEPRPTAYRSSSFTQAFGHRHRHSASSSSSSGQMEPVRGSEVQMRLLEALFRESFENNYDISDRAWLQWLGTSLTNIPPAEIQACLESEEWDRAIDRLSDRNRQEFSAVPVFILQGRFIAGGWQRPELFLDVFERIRTGASGSSGGVFSAPGGPWWQQQPPPHYGGAGPDPSSSA